jgi:peptidoglycan/LPS O-acetylase OafA/YrhL
MAGAVIAVLIIVLFNEDDHHSCLARYGLNVSVLEAAIAWMLVALGSGVGNRALSVGMGWLRTIGRSSYEIYLFHMLIVLGLMGLFNRIHPATALIPLWYVAMLLLSVLLGYIVSRFYSEPLNHQLRSRNLWGRRAAESLPAVTTIADFSK